MGYHQRTNANFGALQTPRSLWSRRLAGEPRKPRHLTTYRGLKQGTPIFWWKQDQAPSWLSLECSGRSSLSSWFAAWAYSPSAKAKPPVSPASEDPAEKDRLFEAVHGMPAVREKAEWAVQWMNREASFTERRGVAVRRSFFFFFFGGGWGGLGFQVKTVPVFREPFGGHELDGDLRPPSVCEQKEPCWSLLRHWCWG